MRILAVLLLVVTLLGGCVSQSDQPQQIDNGNNEDENSEDNEVMIAPDFALEDLSDSMWELEALKGEKVVLYFWSASCKVCTDHMPDLAELQEQLPGDTNLLLVNGGDSRDTAAAVVADYSNLNVLIGGRDLFAPYGVRYTPTTVFINSMGEIEEGYIGPISNDDMVEIIDGIS